MVADGCSAHFKAVTAVFELCHNDWKKLCNQGFFLSLLHGLRILDISW